MAAVLIQNVAVAVVGTITKFAATIGTVTAIAGAQITTPGRFLQKKANGVGGGVPIAGAQVFALFRPTIWVNPDFGPTQYNPVSGAVKGTIGAWMLGAYTRKMNGSWIIGISGTPAVILSPCLVFVSS